MPEAARARAAAFLITAAEGANLPPGRDLIARPQDFDPAAPAIGSSPAALIPGRVGDLRRSAFGLVPRARAGAV